MTKEVFEKFLELTNEEFSCEYDTYPCLYLSHDSLIDGRSRDFERFCEEHSLNYINSHTSYSHSPGGTQGYRDGKKVPYQVEIEGDIMFRLGDLANRMISLKKIYEADPGDWATMLREPTKDETTLYNEDQVYIRESLIAGEAPEPLEWYAGFMKKLDALYNLRDEGLIKVEGMTQDEVEKSLEDTYVK